MIHGTVAVDFDGTIAQYEHGFKHPPQEPPTKGAIAALKVLKQTFEKVVVFSVRASHPDGVQSINEWLKKWNGAQYVDGITAMKPKAVAYIDDRGIHFDGNWPAAIAQAKLLAKSEEEKGQRV